MGLDSITLVLEFEKIFEIGIPGREAEKLVTVKDAADYICGQIVFDNRNIDRKHLLFQQLSAALTEVIAPGLAIGTEQKIYNLVPVADEEKWNLLERKLNYDLPFLYLKGRVGKLLNRILSPTTDFENTSVDRFVDMILVLNYKKILPKGHLQNRYESVIAIMGITNEFCGVDPFDMVENSSFVNDLGIS